MERAKCDAPTETKQTYEEQPYEEERRVEPLCEASCEEGQPYEDEQLVEPLCEEGQPYEEELCEEAYEDEQYEDRAEDDCRDDEDEQAEEAMINWQKKLAELQRESDEFDIWDDDDSICEDVDRDIEYMRREDDCYYDDYDDYDDYLAYYDEYRKKDDDEELSDEERAKRREEAARMEEESRRKEEARIEELYRQAAKCFNSKKVKVRDDDDMVIHFLRIMKEGIKLFFMISFICFVVFIMILCFADITR